MKKHYDYAIIEKNNITLFNESVVSDDVTKCDFLVDVDVDIDEKCLLHLSGKKIVYDLYTQTRVFEEDWEHEPEKRLIMECRRFGKTVRYIRGGWVRTTVRENVSYIFSGFRIKELE